MGSQACVSNGLGDLASFAVAGGSCRRGAVRSRRLVSLSMSAASLSMSAATVDVVFGLCQTSPVHRVPAASIRAVDALLAGVERSSLDMLLLPEMAFAGYGFDSPNSVESFLEEQDGPTFQWAKRTALRLDCVVCVGCAERGDNGVRYNSQLTVSAQGAHSASRPT